MQATIDIDGSYGEGGGQVLRTALALSALTGHPTRIQQIRARRRHPGLAPQHLTGVLALAEVCNAEVRGAERRSTEVEFRPRTPPHADDYLFDVAQAARSGSAGSVTLLLQTLLLPLAFADTTSNFVLKGGTHVAWSPPYDYLAHVYLPTLAPMGLAADCRLAAWGFYPAGGGQLDGRVYALARSVDQPGPGGSLTPLVRDERGALKRVWGKAVACNLPAHIPQRMTDRAQSLLSSAGISSAITPQRVGGAGPGAGIFLIAEYEEALAGFSALGQRGKPSEAVAEEACQTLLAFHASGAPVDRHLADQLLLPMALADGSSRFRTAHITQHLLTNAHIIRQFLPVRITIDGDEGGPGNVQVEGVHLSESTSY